MLINQILDTINADVHTADAELDAAVAAHRATPARLPLDQVNPGQQLLILDTETKLIHHAIRMAAYSTTQSLARGILTGHRFRRSGGYLLEEWPDKTARSVHYPVFRGC